MATDVAETVTVGLLEMDDEAFADVVDQDLRRKAPQAVHDALRSRDVVDRFYAHLVGINRKVEGDLAFRKAECEAADHQVAIAQQANTSSSDASKADALRQAEANAASLWSAYHLWRPNVIRFKSGLDTMIAQVRPLRDEALASKIDPEVHEKMRRRIANLESAIRNHRSSVEPSEATPDDAALWAFVE